MLTNFPTAFPDAKEVPSEGQERLIVELDSDYNSLTCESPKVKICFQKWANGIGWFNQKSLYLTLEQATYLKKEIEQTAVNLKMKNSQAHPSHSTQQHQDRKNLPLTENANNVIQFPAGKSKGPGYSANTEPGSNTAKILPFRSRQGSLS